MNGREMQKENILCIKERNNMNRKTLYRVVFYNELKYSLQGTTQGRYLTGGVPPIRFSM
jgi:hypothetical protein